MYIPFSANSVWGVFDRWVYQGWSNWLPAQRASQSEELVLLALGDDLKHLDWPNAEQAKRLAQLLNELDANKASAIGVVPDFRPLQWPQERLLDMLPANKRGGDSASRLLSPFNTLTRAGRDSNVIWSHAIADQREHAPQLDRQFRWPLFFNIHDWTIAQSNGGHRLVDGSLPLLIRRGDMLRSGFPLSLLAAHRGADSLVWQLPDTLRVANSIIPVSMHGTVRPLPQQTAVTSLLKQTINADQLNQETVGGKLVLLGFTDDPATADALLASNALLTAQLSHAPWWQSLVVMPTLALCWLYAIYAWRRFTTGALLFGWAAWLSAAAGASMLVQAEFGVWLGMGLVAGYISCVTALMLIYSLIRSIRIYARLEADDARLELARLYLDKNEARQAREQLLKTSMSNDTGDMLMETARSYERKRDYGSARDTYKIVVEHFPGMTEASEALDDLSSLTGVQPALGSTLVLSDMPVELPQLGRYELIRQLGKGAMGTVYLANDPKIRRELAIKTLPLGEVSNGDAGERFEREAETAGKLHHPNIVTIYDFGEQDDLAYIAMDYVPGGTLADWTHEDQLLELEVLYRLMHKIALALAYAHQHNVVHRDIKPGNLLFNPDNMTVKVSDFGIARLTDYSKTKTGAILGSPYFMSPEQVAGKKVGPASDIYSLGISFYQLLCGHLPFEGESLTQLAWQITNKPHRNIGKFRKGLPRSANRIINKALQKDPTERFTSATEMAEAFEKGAKGL